MASACFALLLYFFSPPWAAFALWHRVPAMSGLLEVRRAAVVLTQIQHLGAPIQDPLHAAVQWRILFPAVGRLMTAVGLPPSSVFLWSYLGAFATIAYLIEIFRRRSVAWLPTAAAVLILSATTWWFASACWLGYFDSWLIFASLIVLFSPSRSCVFAACVLAPWIDERFVLLGLVALQCRSAPVEATAPSLPLPTDAATRRPPSNLRTLYLPAVALLILYACVRLFLLPTAPGATAAGYLHNQSLATTPGTVLLALWESLRASWLFLIAAIVLLRRHRLLLIAATLLLSLLALTTAQDFARSLELLFPIAALGAVVVLTEPVEATASSLPLSLANQFKPLLYTAAGLALLLPAHQVMSDRTTPILYLYHELNSLSNPPASASPSYYELRGILAMERGDLPQANADLSLAIDLSPSDPASPAQQRGVLYASHGRWPDAQKDFTTMTTAEPQNPDGWFLLAQANLALNQPVEARHHLTQALTLGGPPFASRPDVQRFQQKLGP